MEQQEDHSSILPILSLSEKARILVIDDDAEVGEFLKTPFGEPSQSLLQTAYTERGRY